MTTNHLFTQYKNVGKTVPHISLGKFPTPVESLDSLGEKLCVQNIFIKRDDLSGNLYGGNKVRKLEFLLARALNMGAEKVLTIGFAGSNHSLATTYYAQKTGLGSVSLLMPQPNARYVRKNLLMSFAKGAELHYCKNLAHLTVQLALLVANQWIHKEGKIYVIPAGGSSVTGVLGFINAGLELKAQVDEGIVPEPDYIYVSMGTMGTAAGLIIGLKYAGLKTKVIPVRVVEKIYADEGKLLGLVNQAHNYLKSMDGDIPHVEFTQDDFEMRHDFFGEKYAEFTKAGAEAIKLLKETRGIQLEGSYTGKAMAALISDAKKGILKDKTALFWNTYNSWDFSDEIKDVDYKKLPKGFYRFFEEQFQPLDTN